MVAAIQETPRTELAVVERIAPIGSRRFTVEEYEAIHEHGIFAEDERVELVQGEIIKMAASGIRHVNTVFLTTGVLSAQIHPNGLSVQNPIGMPGDNLPEPDFAVIRAGDYSRRRMAEGDTLFVVEVADSSKRYDLTVKFPLYAAAGIPEAWLFDLEEDRIQRHTDPGPNGYRQITSVGRGESLSSLVLPAVTIAVDDVLGPPVDDTPSPGGKEAGKR